MHIPVNKYGLLQRKRRKKRTHLHARVELNHLFCLNVFQAVDARNTITNREHFARLLKIDIRLLAEDFVLENFGNLGARRAKTCGR